MRNIAGKKRAGQEDVDSDYLFDSFLQRPCLPFNIPAPGLCLRSAVRRVTGTSQIRLIGRRL
jgi:hypothetical protein